MSIGTVPVIVVLWLGFPLISAGFWLGSFIGENPSRYLNLT